MLNVYCSLSMYLCRYTDDGVTKGEGQQVGRKTMHKAPKSSRPFEETTYSNTDHFLSFFYVNSDQVQSQLLSATKKLGASP